MYLIPSKIHIILFNLFQIILKWFNQIISVCLLNNTEFDIFSNQIRVYFNVSIYLYNDYFYLYKWLSTIYFAL